MTKLGDLLKSPPRYGIGAAAVAYRFDLPTYIRITDIDEHGRFSPAPVVSVDSPLSFHYRLSEGDLVIARTGASVGKSYLYRQADGPLVFAGFLMAVTPDPNRLDPAYLGYYLQSKPYWDWVQSESMRSGQPGINARQVAAMPIKAPNIRLQREVAARLHDIDRAADAIEHLISKKRAIKQGMMQELLSGKTRLPGFAGDWAETTVGAVADVKTGPFGSSLHEQDYVASGTPIITVEHLGEFGVEAQGAPLVSESDRRRLRAYTLAEGDIVFSRVGSIDRNSRIGRSEGGWLFSGRLLRIRFKSAAADSRFMGYQFRTERFIELVRSVAVGQTMPSLNTAILKSIALAQPPLAEQLAIGTILSTVDDEIQALERRLESTRNIKRGMMQELLTGRTRLRVSEVAA